MRFGILGPFEVADDEGRKLALGGRKQRAVLAILALHAGRVVSSERLIDELWGERAPATAAKTLQTYVSKLRKALGDGVVLTRAGGYVLDADRADVDASQFRALADEGQGSLREGDFRRAAGLLREALGLWRGPALADFAYESFAQADGARLEESRLAALEDRIDAELGLGEHARLVDELEQRVREHPLRERPAGQLMLALYRSGRQADALEVYRQTSERLRDDLGLEPSRQLRELERSILNQDTTLEAPPRAAPEQPTNLPVPATAFVGRTHEVAELAALLQGAGTRLLTLTGAGGSGKTRLALRLAETCAADYRDGTWFVAFADITDPELIIPTISQTLELAEVGGLAPVRRLKQWLGERQVLMVLDNLEQLADGSAVLAEVLSACPGLTLLVTSREPLHLAGEQQYEVPVLEPGDAVALFESRTQAVLPGLIMHPKLAGAICARLDYLPLAIELAAARARALAPGEILSRLDTRLPLLTGGPRDAPRRQRTLKATIDWSYDLLDDEQRRLLARLAVFAGGCALAAAEAVCGAELDTVQALVDRSLLRSDGERYWMLQTIHEYALEKLESTGEADDMRDAHARWFVHLLDVEGIAPPGWPGDASLTRLAREQENFRAALEWTSSIGDTETLARLTSTLTAVWVLRAQLHEATRWIALVLEHEDMYQPRLAAQVVSAARRLARHQGDTAKDAALAARSHQLWQEVGDIAAIGRAMVDVGYATVRAGDLDTGRELLEKAVGYAREHGLSNVLAGGLNNLADVAIMEDRLDDAIRLSEEGLRVADRASALADVALLNLAHVAMVKNELEDAIQIGRRALNGALERGDLLCVAWAAIGLAWPIVEQGGLQEAARLLGAGLEFLDAAGAGRDWMDAVCEEKVRQTLREEVGEARTKALIEEGRGVPLERAAHEALR